MGIARRRHCASAAGLATVLLAALLANAAPFADASVTADTETSGLRLIASTFFADDSV